MLLYCAVDFFWSRDLFISQDRGLYIEHVNHNLAVVMLNILKCYQSYALQQLLLYWKKNFYTMCHRKYSQPLQECYVQEHYVQFSHYVLGVCHWFYLALHFLWHWYKIVMQLSRGVPWNIPLVTCVFLVHIHWPEGLWVYWENSSDLWFSIVSHSKVLHNQYLKF